MSVCERRHASPVFPSMTFCFDLPSLTQTISPELSVIHYHCIFIPLSQESVAHNVTIFSWSHNKANITVLGQDLSKLFSILPQIPLIFKVTMAKVFSGKISRDKNFSLSLTQVGGICLFLSPLLWERTLFFKKFTTKQRFRSPLNFLMKSAFCFSFLPTVILTSNGRKVLEWIWGQIWLTEEFYHWVID